MRTPFTALLGIEHPLASAPVGEVAGGALAAAVSNAGGLGLVGGGLGERDWLAREPALVTDSTNAPWGVGFLAWAVDPSVLAWPAAVMLGFGDPGPLAGRVREAGVKLLAQVTDLDEARQALDAGADVLVAQGSDAGGHCGRYSVGTMAFVPTVVDLAGPVPVWAGQAVDLVTSIEPAADLVNRIVAGADAALFRLTGRTWGVT
jgi:nitronate monooxygenase